MPTILVVDDQTLLIDYICAALEGEGYDLSTANNIAEAQRLARQQTFDVLISDVVMPGGSGMDLAQFFRQYFPETPVLLITAFASSDVARKAEKLGVTSILAKPFLPEQLKMCIIRALERRAQFLDEKGVAAPNGSCGLHGSSPVVEALRRRIRLLAPTRIPVLVNGPSGTGKELIAKALHEGSPRSHKPMVTVNCASIPHHLEEAEFFGWVKGAFSGADRSREGHVATANGSTLFLDEIGDMSLAVQAKLLRVLENGEYMAVGSSEVHKTDLRIVAATNKDLSAMAARGLFREDLFFRLKGAVVRMPALAERPEDVPTLVQEFLGGIPITREALNLLSLQPWPGNVRELRQTVDALRETRGGLREVTEHQVRDHLGLASAASEEPPAKETYASAKQRTVHEFDVAYFTALMERFSGNVSQAAKAVGMHRPNLQEKLRELGMDAATFRAKGVE